MVLKHLLTGQWPCLGRLSRTLDVLHGQAMKFFALSSDAVQGVHSQHEPSRQIKSLVINVNGDSVPAEHPLRAVPGTV